MTLLETADSLFQLATRLKEEAAKPITLKPDLSITEADQVLARAFKGHEISFTVRRSRYATTDTSPEITWNVYDGNRHHRASTLRDAVAKAMVEARAEKAEGTVAQVDAAIAESTPPCRHEQTNDDGCCKACGAVPIPF